jgi:chaperonin GroES
LVLVKVGDAEEATTGGVLLPTAAQTRPTSGDVVAVGDGRVGENTQDMSLQAGQTVLYNKFGIGTTDVSVKGTLHTLIREDDCIGIMPHSNATAADIPELKPAGDRVLLKVRESAEVTSGGLMLPDSAREKPISGTVVRVGPGKREKDGTRRTPKVKEGDTVLYFKYAGDNLETPSGEKFIVVHEEDILCKC